MSFTGATAADLAALAANYRPPRKRRERRAFRADDDPASPWVTWETAAAMLGCGKTTIVNLINEGKVTKARSPGKRTRLTRASVEAFRDRMTPKARGRRPSA